MELEQAIAQRRSVRKYENKPVEREKINACLEAARLAPSACNSQPWHFVVLDDPQTKEAFCREAFSGVYAMTKWAASAPVIIAVVSDAGNFTARIGNFFRRTEFYLVDQGIACEHLVLRAHDLGLGTCWVCNFDAARCREILGLPEAMEPVALIPIGYPASDAMPEKKRKPLDEILL